MPVTNLVPNLWIRSKWLMSATSFGEQADIPYSMCGRTKAPYKGMKADFWRPWEQRLIMKINRLALFAVPLHWAEGENLLFVWNPRSLSNLDIGMGVPDPSEKKIISGELLAQLWDGLQLVGLIIRSILFYQSHAAVRELSVFMLCVHQVTILTSSAKISCNLSPFKVQWYRFSPKSRGHWLSKRFAPISTWTVITQCQETL